MTSSISSTNRALLEARYSLRQELKDILKQEVNGDVIESALVLLSRWKNEGLCVTESDKRLTHRVITKLELSNTFIPDDEDSLKPSADVLQAIRDYKHCRRNESKIIPQLVPLPEVEINEPLTGDPQKRSFSSAMYIVAGLTALVVGIGLSLFLRSSASPLKVETPPTPPLPVYPAKITQIQECTPGLRIPSETLTKLEGLSGGFFYKGIEYPEIKRHWYGERDVVDFSLKDNHEFEFKIVPQNWFPKIDLQEVCQKSMEAHKVITDKHLHLLELAPSSLLTLETQYSNFSLIVQKKLKIFSDTSDPIGRPYDFHSERMNETVRQLATFIGETNWAMTQYNAPILAEEKEGDNPTRIGIKDMSLDLNFGQDRSRLEGLFYHKVFPHRPGLLNFVDEKHFPIVEAEANKYGVKFSEEDFKTIKAQKEYNKSLRKFYHDKGIMTGYEELELPEMQSDNIRYEIIKKINAYISQRNDYESIKERRQIYFNFGRPDIGNGNAKHIEVLKDMEKERLIFKIIYIRDNGDIAVQA